MAMPGSGSGRERGGRAATACLEGSPRPAELAEADGAEATRQKVRQRSVELSESLVGVWVPTVEVGRCNSQGDTPTTHNLQTPLWQ